jgi:hypothetical protein
MKNIFCATSAVAVLVVGLLSGIYIGDKGLLGSSENNPAALSRRSESALKVYLSGNVPGAIAEFESYLQELQLAINSSEARSKAIALDKLLVLGRLAVLSKADGNPSAEKKYLTMAIFACGELKRKNCTQEGIVDWVEGIDKATGSMNQRGQARNKN